MKSACKNRKISCVFLLGSRLWGTARPDSDYDLYCIVEEGVNPSTVFLNGTDIILKTKTQFTEDLMEGNLLALICCIIPDSHVLKGSRPDLPPILFSKTAPKNSTATQPVYINPQCIQNHLNYRIKRDAEYTVKNCTKGKIDRARKTMFHSLVYVDLGQQILSTLLDTDNHSSALDRLKNEVMFAVGIKYLDVVQIMDPEVWANSYLA
mmetsp:Transcript_14363/g.23871  ORF Transcript_14363/g.23871 Transcript_14363/m.23871 type:complete len:208 (-) Transcript_14363:2102-2725(-)